MVLLVVDTQKGIVDERLYAFETFVSNIRKLIRTAREQGIEIVYVQHDDGPGTGFSIGDDEFEVYSGFAPLLTEKRMSGNTQKEEVYRTAMRICRMWGVAETLDSGIPPYETPITTQSAENEKLVLQWAEEYVQLRENGEELWRFFEKKIKNLRKPSRNSTIIISTGELSFPYIFY